MNADATLQGNKVVKGKGDSGTIDATKPRPGPDEGGRPQSQWTLVLVEPRGGGEDKREQWWASTSQRPLMADRQVKRSSRSHGGEGKERQADGRDREQVRDQESKAPELELERLVRRRERTG